MDIRIEEAIRTLFKRRDFLFDSAVLEARLPSVIKKIEGAHLGMLKKIIEEFAKEGWKDKTITINLPDLQNYPVDITSQFKDHMKERIVEQTGTIDHVRMVAKMIAVVIARLDDIAQRGEKRGWGKSKHDEMEVRSKEKWVYVTDVISYKDLGSFRVILEIRSIPSGSGKPIQLYSGNVDKSSTWETTREKCELTMIYENHAMKVECDLSS